MSTEQIIVGLIFGIPITTILFVLAFALCKTILKELKEHK